MVLILERSEFFDVHLECREVVQWWPILGFLGSPRFFGTPCVLVFLRFFGSLWFFGFIGLLGFLEFFCSLGFIGQFW